MKPIQLPTITSGQNYDAIDPLDSRYADPEIAKYVSERSRIAYQAYVEGALAHTLAEFGVCSPADAEAIENAAAKITAEDVYAEEKTTKHDIKAIVNCIKKQLPETAQPYVHFGATSYDIMSSASALQYKQTVDELLVPRLTALIKTLVELTEKYADTVQIGRTHGQHAVPITFGYEIAEFVSRLGENLIAVQELAHALPGKFSGAVGAANALSLFVNDPIGFEANLLDRLGLKPAAYATQIVPAEYTIRLLDELTLTAGIMANLAHDMRNLQRSEIAEVRERFEPGQTGSSTMAHKRNPWNFENVVSMSKQVTGQLMSAQLNISSEHQRDLTDSASSRFYTSIFAIIAGMAKRLASIMAKLEVDDEAMQKNLLLTGGAIAAEPLYLLFEKYGHTEAHELSKNLAHRALEANQSLYQVASTDPEAATYWQQFTDREKAIIEKPEQLYTGLAAQKAKTVAAHWRAKLNV